MPTGEAPPVAHERPFSGVSGVVSRICVPLMNSVLSPGCYSFSCSPLPSMRLAIQHSEGKVKAKVALLCPTLWESMDYTDLGVLQARILEWVAFLFSGNLCNPGIEPRYPTLQADSLPAEPQGSPRILEWVAYPFSSGYSQPINQMGISCISGRFFTV